MPPDDDLLEHVADAILDGTPIDWAAVESRTDGTSRGVLGRLRVLSQLAHLHRHSPTPSLTPESTVPAVATTATAPPIGESAGELAHWGHLRLLERIGHGASGQVYRAYDTRLDRDVALKLLPAHVASGGRRGTSIIEEGRLLARVRHPNVVIIHDAERIGDQVGLSMELVGGLTLEQMLEQGTRFTVAETVTIGLQLCQAMAAVHEAGLLHRDIKAQNVMMTGAGRVVLMDFGTGCDPLDGSSATLAGTPLYLAPELLRGSAPTVQSDIYSLGVPALPPAHRVLSGTGREPRPASGRTRTAGGIRRRDARAWPATKAGTNHRSRDPATPGRALRRRRECRGRSHDGERAPEARISRLCRCRRRSLVHRRGLVGGARPGGRKSCSGSLGFVGERGAPIQAIGCRPVRKPTAITCSAATTWKFGARIGCCKPSRSSAKR